MPDDKSDWVEDIAGKVHDLILLPHALDRFHEMLLLWWEERLAKFKAWRFWWDKRREHFERAIAPQTKEDKALTADIWGSPPQSGWESSVQDLPIPDHFTPSGTAFLDMNRADWQELTKEGARERITAWVPPELFWQNEPACPETLPLPLTPIRELSTAEKYLCVSLCHDLVCLGAKAINPWKATGKKIPRQALAYRTYLGKICSLSDAHETPFRTFLTDIEADLKANPTEQDNGKATPPKKRGRKPMTKERRAECKNHYNEWKKFHVDWKANSKKGSARKAFAKKKNLPQRESNAMIRSGTPKDKKKSRKPRRKSHG